MKANALFTRTAFLAATLLIMVSARAWEPLPPVAGVRIFFSLADIRPEPLHPHAPVVAPQVEQVGHTLYFLDESQNNNNNNNGNNDNSVGELHISWTEGNTQGQNDLSEVTVSAKMTNYRYCVLQNNLYTTWVAPYEVAIHGTIVFQRDSEQLEYSIDGRYTIPMEYYQI